MRFCGKIGFSDTAETIPGIWENQIVERTYYGDVTRRARRLQTDSKSVNDDIRVTNDISIVADQYAYDHFHTMLYVEYMGTKWKAESVEVVIPRLNITLGGEYNGDTGSQA
jgi:hypothetical protein